MLTGSQSYWEFIMHLLFSLRTCLLCYVRTRHNKVPIPERRWREHAETQPLVGRSIGTYQQ